MKPRTELETEQRIGRPNRGSATFLALFTLALLTFIGATVLISVTRRYNGNEKAQGWQEALQAAEAGADVGLQNLRWVATAASTPFDTTLGWTKNTTDPNNTVYTYTTPTLTTGGEGTAQTWAVVTVDGPPQLIASGNQWYRVRSTGHAKLSGLAQASNDVLTDPNARNKNSLRKFSLIRDRATGTALAAPEATRTIEQIVRPKTPFIAALAAATSVTISGNQFIDSYDPTNSNEFKNGLIQFNPNSPDPSKHGTNGTVVVGGTRDGTVLQDGTLSIASGEKVYGTSGDYTTDNKVVFTDPNHTIQAPAQIDNTLSNTLAGVPNPNWGTINASPTTISSTTTLTVNSDPTQNNYKLSTIGAPLTVAPQIDPVTKQPIPGTINLWVTGDVNTQVKSGALITVQKGVTLKIYLGTDGTGGTKNNAPAFHPQGYGGNLGAIDNQNQDPATFQLYAVGTQPGGNGGSGIDLHTGGAGVQNFYGTVYAPYRYVIMKYDGSTNYDTTSGYYGSFVGNNFSKTEGSFHYDEALSSIGVPVDFLRASYVEDPR